MERWRGRRVSRERGRLDPPLVGTGLTPEFEQVCFTTVASFLLVAYKLGTTSCSPLAPLDAASILAGCYSLIALILFLARIAIPAFLAAPTSPHFAANLRRLTLTDFIMESITLPSLPKTLLNLRSLQLVGYTCDPTRAEDVARVVEDYHPSRRRWPSGSPIAPLESLVLRPSYRKHSSPIDVTPLAALLAALSPTLRRLHLPIHPCLSSFLLLLLSDQVAVNLEQLWIGYLTAQEEIGDGVRLTRADDQQIRTGLTRCDAVVGDRDPLSVEVVALPAAVFRLKSSASPPDFSLPLLLHLLPFDNPNQPIHPESLSEQTLPLAPRNRAQNLCLRNTALQLKPIFLPV